MSAGYSRTLQTSHRPGRIAGVSGWIGERKDYLKVWSRLEAPDSEVFSLVWESKALLALNSAIGSFMAQQAYQEIAKWTITHVSETHFTILTP